LRLLFLVKSLATAGGAEKVLSQISAALAARNHELILASFDAESAPDFYDFGQMRRVRLSVGDPADHTAVRDFVTQVKRLRRLIRKTRPHASIGFMHSAFVPLAIASIGTRCPLIASEHTSVEHYHGLRWQLRLVRATAPLCAAYTVQSERLRDAFPRHISKRMIVVPNPVAVEGRVSAAPVRADRRTLLCVGRLRPEKGHSTLLKAFAAIASTFPDWTLRLVGDGPCFDALLAEAGWLGLGDRVEFAGALRNVAAEYASADLVAMPSAYETFGLATAEALACGVPVVGYADCPGTNELVQPGVNGILVSGTDRAAALADGLATLMADDELRLRLGSAAPATVTQHSVEAATDRWEDLITKVVAARR
jgi:glycosyltransferase involved in cell wall biosynthesis